LAKSRERRFDEDPLLCSSLDNLDRALIEQSSRSNHHRSEDRVRCGGGELFEPG
jgi:hypothetical protein